MTRLELGTHTVLHTYPKAAPVQAGLDLHTTDALFGLAVLDRIFHERLEDERRHPRLERFGRRGHRNLEAIVEADPLHVHVGLHRLELPL